MASELILMASYHQIQVFDEGSSMDLGSIWTDEADAAGIVVAEDALAIVTSTDFDVQVTVEVLQQSPPDLPGQPDHVVEGDLRVPSGRAVVMSATGYLPDATRFEVRPGWHRVRAVRLPSDPAIEEELDVEERLRLSIWPIERATG